MKSIVFFDKLSKNIGLILVLFISVWIVSFFVLSFINSKGCNQIVTDSNEIRSGTDIPDPKDFCSCTYDADKDVRMTVYKLKNNVENYLQVHSAHFDNRHGFNPVSLKDVNFALPLTESEKPLRKELYISAGTKWGNTWQYVVEKESGRMWVEMKYTPTLATNILEIITSVIFLPLPALFLTLYLCKVLRNFYMNRLKRRITDPV